MVMVSNDGVIVMVMVRKRMHPCSRRIALVRRGDDNDEGGQRAGEAAREPGLSSLFCLGVIMGY
jgi:hypothetical protein